MKKLILFIMLLIPIIVFADMEVPALLEFDAYVTNPKGANYYILDHNEKNIVDSLRFEEKIHVLYENNNYAYFRKDSNIYAISSKDIVAINTFDLDDSVKKKITIKLDKPAKIKTLEELDIKEGPANAFKSLGKKIPKNTVLEYSYILDSFVYVNYKGVSGWINTLNGNVGFYSKNIDYITKNDITVKDTKGKVIKKYKQFQKINNFLNLDIWSSKIYIDNTNDAFIDFKDLYIYNCYEEDNGNYAKTKIEFEMYNNYTNSKKVIGSIPEGSLIKESCYLIDATQDSVADEWIKVFYKGRSGWILVKASYLEENGEPFIYEFIPEEEQKEDIKTETNIVDMATYGFIATIITGIFTVAIIVLINNNGKKEYHKKNKKRSKK